MVMQIHLAQKRESQAGALYHDLASLLEVPEGSMPFVGWGLISLIEQKMNKNMEAACYFKEAATLQLKYSPTSAITSYQHSARCLLLQRTFIPFLFFFLAFHNHPHATGR